MKVQVEIDTEKLPTQDEIIGYICNNFLTEKQAVLYKGAASGQTNSQITREIGSTRKVTGSNITEVELKVSRFINLLEFANPCRLYQGGYDKTWGWQAR